MDDLISRQSAKDAYCKHFCHPGAFCPDGYCKEVNGAFDSVPSAQPDLPEWAQAVERMYNKALCNPYIQNPLAWALYQAWKEYDK